MTIENLLNLFTQIIFLWIAGITLLDWARQRNETHLDIALVFVSLAITILAQDLQGILPALAPLLTLIFFVGLITQPYLLLRVARYLRPIPGVIREAARIGLLLVFASLLLSKTAPILVFVLAIGYFLIIESYATFLLFRGAHTIPGITGRRLRFAFVGSGLLAFVFSIALVFVLYSSATVISSKLEAIVAPLIQAVAILAGLSYYFGFAPPRWLRHAWQLAELHHFLTQTSGGLTRKHTTTFEELSTAATRIVGGATAVIADCDIAGQHLAIELSGEPPMHIESLENDIGAIGQAWRERCARVAYIPNETGPAVNRWAEQFEARALFIVPIQSTLRAWGLLIVILRYTPLFVQDDLDLLRLLVEQSATALDYSALIEERLRESEERYKRFFENMHETFIIQEVIADEAGKPIDLRYVDINPAAERSLGRTRSDIIGRTRSELTGQPDLEGVEMANRVASTGTPFHMIRHSPGFGGWFESFTYSLRSGMVATLALDITDRKQAEEALQKAHDELELQVQLRTAALSQADALLQTMLDYVPDQIYFKDAESRFIKNSRSQAQALGLSDPSQVVGKTDFDFFPHAQRSYTEEQEIMRSGKPLVDFEERVVWPDHRETWVSTTKVPLRNQEGEIIGTFGISRDITERKRAEETLRKAKEELEVKVAERTTELSETNERLRLELGERKRAEVASRRSEERLNGMIASAMDAIISVDSDQLIVLFNAAAEKMFDCLVSDAVGQPLERFIPERYRAIHREHIRSFGRTGVTNRAMSAFGVVFGLRTNGEEFAIEASISQIEIEEKKLYTVILRDITDRKRAEGELKRSNAELEQFAYVASHDLQEPLRAVAGMVQLLGQRYQGKLDARADEYIELAVEGSNRMQKLINDLLTYSRIGRQGKTFEPTNIDGALKIALANLQVAIQESGVVVTHDPLPTVLADSSQLIQVFQNLIGNAIKFRGERPLLIHISAQELDHEWRFAIRDNGIGIEPQYFERIFLVFQRLHTRREYPGTGIGLSLCKKIVERHGGSIWVESDPGQGSIFYFTIPRR